MCDCDCEGPSAFRQETRRARKDHRCCECGGVIEAKDYYQYTSGIWDHRPDSYRTCWPCVAFRNMMRRVNAGYRGYCEPCFTQLYDGEPRENWPPHLVAAQEARRLARQGQPA